LLLFLLSILSSVQKSFCWLDAPVEEIQQFSDAFCPMHPGALTHPTHTFFSAYLLKSWHYLEAVQGIQLMREKAA
jgi:hypothetical protein